MEKNFFAIEGTDGCGKATQTALLVERLWEAGYEARSIALPQYRQPSACLVEEYKAGKFGHMLDVNPRKAAFCFAADRLTASLTVKRWLDQKMVVIADRWTASNFAFQGAKCVAQEIGFACTNLIAWIDQLEHDFLNIPEPQLYIILDVFPETSARLLKDQGKILDGHEQSLSYQQKVRKVYLWLADRHPDKYQVVQCCESDGAMLSEQEIHEKIWEIVAKNL